MTLGLVKNGCFRDGTDVRADQRSYLLALISVLGNDDLETFVRPRLVPLHTLADSKDVGSRADEKSGSGAVQLPTELGLAADQMTSDGAYLIDNGSAATRLLCTTNSNRVSGLNDCHSVSFIIRLGRNISQGFLADVFGVTSLDQVDVKVPSLVLLLLLTLVQSDTANSQVRAK